MGLSITKRLLRTIKGKLQFLWKRFDVFEGIIPRSKKSSYNQRAAYIEQAKRQLGCRHVLFEIYIEVLSIIIYIGINIYGGDINGIVEFFWHCAANLYNIVHCGNSTDNRDF